MLKYRLPSAVLLIALLSLAIWGIYKTYLFWLLPCLAFLGVFFASREMFAILKENEPFRKWGFFSAFFLTAAGYLFFRYPSSQRVRVVLAFALILVFIGTFLMPLIVGRIKGALNSAAATFLTLLYVPVSFSFLLGVALIGFKCTTMDGRIFLPYFVAIVKGADIGAYCVGTLFARSPLGNHKFVPEISPKKSIEGVFGGLFLSLALGVLGALYLPGVSEAMLRMGGSILSNRELGRIIGAVILSLILSLLGIVGDLVESVWKRDSGIKDSGDYIPGMGGVLDVVDSLLLTAPIMYALILTISRF